MTAPWVMVEEISDWVRVKPSTSDEMDHRLLGRTREEVVVTSGSGMEFKPNWI